MLPLTQFLSTVYLLVANRRWRDLEEYFALIREILNRPTAIITAGKPRDKEIN